MKNNLETILFGWGTVVLEGVRETSVVEKISS
jgi:hypothetical protein